jgi:ankyrin repeat protein
VVEALLYAGVNPDERDANSRTALICMKNLFYRLEPLIQVKMLDILLPKKPNVNTQDNVGHTALAYAALFGHTEAVSVLLTHGADPLCRIKDPQSNSREDGMSVFVLLASCDLDERLEQDQRIANILRDHLLPLLVDKNGHKISIVEHELNDEDLGGTTLLHYMAQSCHYESCSLLLSTGADVNSLKLKAGYKTIPGKRREFRTPLAEALSYKTFQETIALPRRVSKSSKACNSHSMNHRANNENQTLCQS